MREDPSARTNPQHFPPSPSGSLDQELGLDTLWRRLRGCSGQAERILSSSPPQHAGGSPTADFPSIAQVLQGEVKHEALSTKDDTSLTHRPQESTAAAEQKRSTWIAGHQNHPRTAEAQPQPCFPRAYSHHTAGTNQLLNHQLRDPNQHPLITLMKRACSLPAH